MDLENLDMNTRRDLKTGELIVRFERVGHDQPVYTVRMASKEKFSVNNRVNGPAVTDEESLRVILSRIEQGVFGGKERLARIQKGLDAIEAPFAFAWDLYCMLANILDLLPEETVNFPANRSKLAKALFMGALYIAAEEVAENE